MAQSPDSTSFALRRLLSLARDLLEASGLKSMLEAIGPTLQELMAPDEALLLLDLGEQRYITAFNPQGLVLAATPGSILFDHTEQAFASQSPVVVPSIEEENPPGRRKSPKQASLIALPFQSGVLAVLWHQAQSEAQLAGRLEQLRELSALTQAALVNIDIRIAREEEASAKTAAMPGGDLRAPRQEDHPEMSLEHAAITDELTGMLNRQGFFLHAEQHFKLARRQKKTCAVIFADIDGLQAINEELGHQFGDRLIQASAQILRNSFRDSDIVARLGGDEFAALTLDPGHPEAILARLRDKTLEFHRQQASTPYRVSFSTGIVQCDPLANLSLSDYLALADRLMLEEKKGRAA